MEGSVSKYLQEECGIPDATPGRKCQCPRCGHHTFSIKNDDSFGKCFHPKCSEYVTLKHLGDTTQATLAKILKNFCLEAHQQLLKESNSAYRYLVDTRKIHPKVIADSMMGIFPEEYDIELAFNESIAKKDAKITELKAKLAECRRKKDQDSLLNDIENNEKFKVELGRYEIQFKVIEDKYNGWLIFFHTDANLNITKLRLRKPFSKDFVTFKFSESDGIFGVNLYEFSKEEELFAPLLITEGEFNSLRLQSLLLCKFEEAGVDLNKVEYFNCISLGSSSDPDLYTVKAIDPHPIINFDRDVAGFSVVQSAQNLMHLSAFCVSEPNNDLDEFIDSYGNAYSTALDAIRELMLERKYFYRLYEAVIEEINFIRRSRNMKDFEINRNTADKILEDLRQRATFLNDGKAPYIFNKENKILHAINPGNIDQVKLLYNYKLNQSEGLYKS